MVRFNDLDVVPVVEQRGRVLQQLDNERDAGAHTRREHDRDAIRRVGAGLASPTWTLCVGDAARIEPLALATWSR